MTEPLHHVRCGEGPPLVLLHGLGSHAGVWDPVLPRLAEHHDVLAIDMPGFGRSAPRGRVYDPPALATAVAETMDLLGVETAHAAGNSLGGRVALELALLDRAGSVVAISPSGAARGWEQIYARTLLRTARKLARELDPLGRWLCGTSIGRRVLFSVTMADPDAVEPEWGREAVHHFAWSPGFPAVLTSTSTGQVTDRFVGIDVPVRIAWGTRDMLLLPRQAERFVQAIPHAELEMLDGLGHTPMSDDPDRVAEVILDVTAG
jgi:pimeloyl-ACP methyl ester carboxylesterase